MIDAVVDVDLARHQWQDARRAVERARLDSGAFERLTRQAEVVTAALSLRVGQTFTLEDLAAAWTDADRWARAAIHEALPGDAPFEVSTAAGVAFSEYARRASDYRP